MLSLTSRGQFIYLYFTVFVSICVSPPAKSTVQDDKYYVSGVVIFIKYDNTPLRAGPSVNSPIVSQINRQSISMRDILAPRHIPKGGVDPKSWIQIAPGHVSERGGWLIRGAVLTPDEFQPIKIWPIKAYWYDFGDSMQMFRFTPDGQVNILNSRYGTPENVGKWIAHGQILHSHGILITKSGDDFAFYDERKRIICDFPINDTLDSLKEQDTCRKRITYFTDAEIKAYLKAKAAGKPLPEIDYSCPNC